MYLCLRSFRPFNWHTASGESSKPCSGTVYTDDTESGPNVMTSTFHMFVFCLLSFKTCGTKTALLPIWYVFISLSWFVQSVWIPSDSNLNITKAFLSPLPISVLPEHKQFKTSSHLRACSDLSQNLYIKKKPYITSPLAEKGPTFAFSKSSLGGFGSASPGYTSV